MRNKYLRLFIRSEDHDARIIYIKVNRLIFHTGFYLIFFLYSYFIWIVYCIYFVFCFIFFSLFDAIFAYFVMAVVLKKFAKVTQLNLLINIKYLFFEKVKSSMLMTSFNSVLYFHILSNTHMSLHFIFFVSYIDRFSMSGKEKYQAFKIQLTLRSHKYCNIGDCFLDGSKNSFKKLTFPVCLS